MRKPLYQNLRDGLVGAWSPAAQARTVGATGYMLPDLSGRGNHGTLTNMDPATDWVTVGGYPALDFDGSNDGVTANLSSVAQLSACREATWAGWCRPTSLNAYRTLTHFTTGLGMYIAQNATDMTSSWENGADEYNRATGLTMVANAWNFIAVSNSVGQGLIQRVISNSTHSWKVDSQSKTLTAKTLNVSWYFGNNAAASSSFPGQIADILFWSRFLTLAELQQIYTLGPGGWATPRRRRSYAAQAAAPTATRSSFKTMALCR